MVVNKTEAIIGRVVLVLVLILTLLPLAGMLSGALQPADRIPDGFSWPSDPQWGNFVVAFQTAHVWELLGSSTLIILGVVPLSLLLSTLAGYALGNLRILGGRFVFVLLLLGLTIPFEAIIIPIYYEISAMGLLNTQWAIILPLIGLYMPFGVVWMRAHFVGVPPNSPKRPGSTGRAPSRRSAASRFHWPCPPSSPWPSCCSYGPGTSSSFPWSWSTIPTNAPWPGPWERSRGSTSTSSPCCSRAR